MEAHGRGEEVWLLLILNLGTRWGWVVSITPRPCFTPGEMTFGTHWIGSWVGPRAGLDAGTRRKILCPCRGSNPDRPARSQALYCLSYHGSQVETSSTFNLTWTDLNNNLKKVNCYLTLQFTGTYESSCFSRWYYWKPNWKERFLIVNVHKTSDKWSNDDICTFLKCTKSTKCYGTLKAISRSSLQKCERWRNEKLLEEINTERVNCRLCSEKN
jgi:hypothetical protein